MQEVIATMGNDWSMTARIRYGWLEVRRMLLGTGFNVCRHCTRWVAVRGSVWLLVVLSGCTDMLHVPRMDELDWDPASLSMSNCPDLSGRYLIGAQPGINYRWIFFGTFKSLYPNREIFLREADLDVFVTVESRQGGVYIKADNGRRSVDSDVVYDALTVGCSQGAVVYRYMGPPIHHVESSGGVSLSYGEYRAFLDEKRNIRVIANHRVRCARVGSLADVVPDELDPRGECRSLRNVEVYQYQRISD